MAEHRHHHPHAHGFARAEPGFSLLRLSAGRRLAGAAVLVLFLWGAVLWAVSGS